MKYKFHTCYIEMQPKKSMEFGFTIPVNVRKLQISLIGIIPSFSSQTIHSFNLYAAYKN